MGKVVYKKAVKERFQDFSHKVKVESMVVALIEGNFNLINDGELHQTKIFSDVFDVFESYGFSYEPLTEFLKNVDIPELWEVLFSESDKYASELMLNYLEKEFPEQYKKWHDY